MLSNVQLSAHIIASHLVARPSYIMLVVHRICCHRRSTWDTMVLSDSIVSLHSNDITALLLSILSCMITNHASRLHRQRTSTSVHCDRLTSRARAPCSLPSWSHVLPFSVPWRFRSSVEVPCHRTRQLQLLSSSVRTSLEGRRHASCASCFMERSAIIQHRCWAAAHVSYFTLDTSSQPSGLEPDTLVAYFVVFSRGS